MKNFRMKTKLFIMFALTGLIPLVVLSCYIGFSAEREIENEVFRGNKIFASLTQAQLNQYFLEREGNGTVLSTTREVYEGLGMLEEFGKQSDEWTEGYGTMDKLLSAAKEKHGYFNVFLTDTRGRIVYATEDKEAFEGLDLSSRAYFPQAMSGTQNWSELFYSDIVEENIILLATPVLSEGNAGKIIGTINLILNQKRLDEIVHQGAESIGESGDSYLIDETGLLITNTRLGAFAKDAALKKSVDTKTAKVLTNEIKNGNADFTYTGQYDDYLGNPVFGSMSVIKMGDVYKGLIIEVDVNEAFAGINGVRTITQIAVLIAVIIGSAIAYYFARIISTPLSFVVNQATAIANLDMTVDIPEAYRVRKDEIGELAQSFHGVVNNLRNIIRQISESSQQVAASSEELSAISEQSAGASEQVARTIEGISAGATEQARDTQQGAARAENLGQIVEQDHVYTKELNLSTNSVASLIGDGLEIVEELTEKTDASSTAAEEVCQSILKANESSVEIGQVSNVIASIAAQTNLLALNAAIEAARAGENGKGFAVVAEEIRTLAEQSTDSTKTIDNIVKELQNNVEGAVETVQRVTGILTEQAGSVKVTEEKYQEIARAIQKAEHTVKNLTISGQNVGQSKDEILKIMQNLSSIAQEYVASTQEVTASVEEQTASAEEIARTSEELSGLAQKLNHVIGRFKI